MKPSERSVGCGWRVPEIELLKNILFPENKGFQEKFPRIKFPKKCSHLSFLVVEDGLDVGANAERVVVIEDQTFGWQVGPGATSEDLNQATLSVCVLQPYLATLETMRNSMGKKKPVPSNTLP